MDPNSVAEIVKAISLLQVVMKEPWAQKLLQQNLSIPPVGNSDVEMMDAMNGKPSSSAPKRVATPAVLPKPEDSKPEAPAATPVTPAATPVAPDPPMPSAPADTVAPEVVQINSSTHRAAHARLVRKMQSLGEVEAPNMTRLFNGTRKDGCLTQKKR